MIRVYSIFSLVMDDISFKEGKIYFFPPLNGTFGGLGEASGFIPILFVDKDY